MCIRSNLIQVTNHQNVLHNSEEGPSPGEQLEGTLPKFLELGFLKIINFRIKYPAFHVNGRPVFTVIYICGHRPQPRVTRGEVEAGGIFK